MWGSLQEVLTQVNHFSLKWTTYFSKTPLANYPSSRKIFPPLKFGINQTTGSKIISKKFIYGQNNFLAICGQNDFSAITFEPVVRLIPNFEGAKICKGGGLFDEAAKPLSQ